MLHKTLAIVDKDYLNQLLEVEKTGDAEAIERYRSELTDILLEQEMPRLQDAYDAIIESRMPMDTGALQLKLQVLHELEQSLVSQ